MEYQNLKTLACDYENLNEKRIDIKFIKDDLFFLTHAGNIKENTTYAEVFSPLQIESNLTPEEKESQKRIHRAKYYYAFAARDKLKKQTPDTPFFQNENKLESRFKTAQIFKLAAICACLLIILAIFVIIMGIVGLAAGAGVALVAWVPLYGIFNAIQRAWDAKIYKNMDKYMPEINKFSAILYKNREVLAQQLEQSIIEAEQYNESISNAQMSIIELFQSLFGEQSSYYRLNNFAEIEEDLKTFGIDFVRGKLEIISGAQESMNARLRIESLCESVNRLIARSINPNKVGYITETGEIRRY